METKDLVSTLKRFDAYPKTLEDFRVKTFGGAAGKFVSSICSCVMKSNRIFSGSRKACSSISRIS